MTEVTDRQTPRDEYMLTTFDNPYDPFTQWDEWYAFDMRAGYHTPGLLARVSHSSHEISEADQFWAIQNAVDEIVRENVSGMHRKVKRGEYLIPAKEDSQSSEGQEE